MVLPHTTHPRHHATRHLVAALASGALLASALAAATPAHAAGVIPDAGYRNCIDRELSLRTGTQPTSTQLESITSLNCSDDGITSLAGTSHMHHLQHLEANSSPGADVNTISSLPDLSGNPHLTELDVDGSQISQLSPLAGAPQLKVLDVGSNRIHSLAPLATLNHLTNLTIADNPITDLTPLAGHSDLQTLESADTELTSLAPLAGDRKLENLDVGSGFGMNQAVLPGEAPVQLCDVFDYGHGNKITSLAPLANLKNLTFLNACGNDVTNVAPLANHPKLVRLDLSGNVGWPSGKHPLTSLAGLRNLPHLYTLYLIGNQIASAAPLAAIPSLTTVNMAYGALTTTAGLTSLHNPYLDVSFNRLANTSALSPQARTSRIYGAGQQATGTTTRAGVPTLVPRIAGVTSNPVTVTPPKGAKVDGQIVTYPTKGTYTWTFHNRETRQTDPAPFDGTLTITVTS